VIAIMPSRADLLQQVRVVAEGIMESLRLLLMVLMNQFDGPLLNQEVSTEYINQMTMLVGEVQNQRVRIEELTQLMQQQPMTGSPGRNLGHPTFRVPDSEEEWEPVSPQQRVPEMVTTRNQTSQNRSTVQPARMDPPMPSTPPRTQRHASTTPTVPAPTSQAGNPGAPSHLTETQIVLANTSLEGWGNKRVSWGKKHLQAKYSDVYEGDYQYLQWLEARARTHTPAMTDFIAYCQTRENMERRALALG